MMKKNLIVVFLLLLNFVSAQLSSDVLGKWNLKVDVSTEFKDTETAINQVKTNTSKYSFLDDSVWNFKKEGQLEVKLKNGTTELANYSANEDRFIIIFEKEDIEEFNTTTILQEDKKIKLSMGRGMTQLIFNFMKK